MGYSKMPSDTAVKKILQTGYQALEYVCEIVQGALECYIFTSLVVIPLKRVMGICLLGMCNSLTFSVDFTQSLQYNCSSLVLLI